MLNTSVSSNNILIFGLIPFRSRKYIFIWYYHQKVQYINLYIMLILVTSLFSLISWHDTAEVLFSISVTVAFLFHFPKKAMPCNIVENLSAFILSPCFLESNFQHYAINYCSLHSEVLYFILQLLSAAIKAVQCVTFLVTLCLSLP